MAATGVLGRQEAHFFVKVGVIISGWSTWLLVDAPFKNVVDITPILSAASLDLVLLPPFYSYSGARSKRPPSALWTKIGTMMQ